MSDFANDYLRAAVALLEEIGAVNADSFRRAAALIADAYCSGRKIYVFGCTHSAILAEDVFYRAGAPAFWQPLWGPGMSIAGTPGFLTSAAERNEELGNSIIDNSNMSENDVLLVISSSGKNAAPVAVAERALRRGAHLIIVSSSHYRNEKGNHSRIPSLWSMAKEAVMVDNCVVCGDAAVAAHGVPMGPLSTVGGSYIMHSISGMAVELLAERGVTPPVFRSSNAPGGAQFNAALLELPGMRDKFMLP